MNRQIKIAELMYFWTGKYRLQSEGSSGPVSTSKWQKFIIRKDMTFYRKKLLISKQLDLQAMIMHMNAAAAMLHFLLTTKHAHFGLDLSTPLRKTLMDISQDGPFIGFKQKMEFKTAPTASPTSSSHEKSWSMARHDTCWQQGSYQQFVDNE